MSLSWSDLFAIGSLFDLNAGFWSGQIRLKAADLGIPNTKEVQAAINMAHVRMVEKEAIDDIRRTVQEARNLIEENSIPFPLVQGAKFIPVSRRPDLEERLRQLKIQFDASVNIFIVEYEELRQKMEPIIRKAIREAAKGDPEAGIDRVLKAYPPRESIRHKFHFDWVSFAISAPLDGAISSEVEKASGQVSDAVKSMVSSLRDRVAQKLSEIIDLIVRGGKYSTKTVNAARRSISNARKLNILNDRNLEDTLRQFDGVLATYDGSDNNPQSFQEIKDSLQKDLDEATEEATNRLMSLGERNIKL